MSHVLVERWAIEQAIDLVDSAFLRNYFKALLATAPERAIGSDGQVVTVNRSAPRTGLASNADPRPVFTNAISSEMVRRGVFPR